MAYKGPGEQLDVGFILVHLIEFCIQCIINDNYRYSFEERASIAYPILQCNTVQCTKSFLIQNSYSSSGCDHIF